MDFLGKNIDILQATDVLEEMEMKRESPTVEAYSEYLCSLCRVGYADLAVGFIQNLRNKDWSFCYYCYNVVIQCLCLEGEAGEAFKLFQDMRRCGLFPNGYSYRVLIIGFARKGILMKLSI